MGHFTDDEEHEYSLLLGCPFCGDYNKLGDWINATDEDLSVSCPGCEEEFYFTE